MPRRAPRRSSSLLDTLLRWAVYVGLAAVAVLVAASFLVEVHWALALLVLFGTPVVAVAVAIWLWQRRRRIRRREARMRLLQAQQLGSMLTVSGAEFETIIGELFAALGYHNIERIGGSGDLGVDLIAVDPDGLAVVIQCKRYGRGNKVGSPAVQSLMGTVVNRGADRGIFVTTSNFTAPAVQHAATARVPITLVDGDEITRLAVEAASDAEVGDRADEARYDERILPSEAPADDLYSTWPKPPRPSGG